MDFELHWHQSLVFPCGNCFPELQLSHRDAPSSSVCIFKWGGRLVFVLTIYFGQLGWRRDDADTIFLKTRWYWRKWMNILGGILLMLLALCVCGTSGKSGILGGSSSKEMRALWKVPCLLSKGISGVFPAESVNGSCQDVYFVWSKWMRRFPILGAATTKKSLNFVYLPKGIRLQGSLSMLLWILMHLKCLKNI